MRKEIRLGLALSKTERRGHLEQGKTGNTASERQGSIWPDWRANFAIRRDLMADLMGAIPDPVVVYNPAGEAVFVNEAFVKVYGWLPEELLGRRIDFVPESEVRPTLLAWQRTLSGEKVVFETRRRTRSGRLLDIQLRTAILQDEEGRHLASIVIHRDVTEARQARIKLEEAHRDLELRVQQRTAELSQANQQLLREIEERKKAEESLRQSKKRLDLAMEATSDALWDLDLLSHAAYFNPCYYTMLGYQPYELEPGFATWKALVHPDDLKIILEGIDTFVEDRVGTFKTEYRMRTQSGGWRWIMARGKVVERDADGRPARLVGTHVDITEQKRNEEVLRQSEALLREENLRLKSTLKSSSRFGRIIGKSPVMQKVYESILRSAQGQASVIIYGESGTGKELVARTIHELSDRNGQRFVPVNCGALPETLIESEFFGYRKGAFTGANMDKPGYLDMAEGGTLFMDEIGELGLSMQIKLLRAIEGGGFSPIGSSDIKQPNVRIISATNRDLRESVKSGRMREDFYYRIHIVPLHLPPLRKRREDLALLIHHFLELYGADRNIPTVPQEMLQQMQAYDWPGNVRELQNAIHRYVTLNDFDFHHYFHADGPPVGPPAGVQEPQPPGDTNLRRASEEFEKRLIVQVLNRCRWHRGQAAAALGINRKTLFKKMKEL